MFTNISWADYLVVITLLLAAYYLIIGIRFYTHELRTWLSGLLRTGLHPLQSKTIPVPSTSFSTADVQNKLPEESETLNLPGNPEDNAFTEEERLTSYLKEVITQAAARAEDRTSLIRLLQLVLNEHPALQEPTYREIILALVISESQIHDSLALSEAEVAALWQTED